MTLATERQQFAEQNEMSLEFVNWFFDEKKEGCGNAWFIMAAAMWEGWNAYRAAMLAQPVSSGYKLPNGWIPCSEQMPELDKRVYTIGMLNGRFTER